MRIFAILGLLMALSLGPATPALAQIKVLTSFTVFADMARNVAGEHAEVVSITREGAEIHMFRPTPGDIKRGLGADVVLWNGLGLETWFERYLENLGDVKAYVLSDGVEPISIGDGPYEGRANPHAWMSPGNANIYIDNIVRALSETDPDNAAAYAANGEAYKTQIAATFAPIRAPSRRCRKSGAGW
jgi:manganese/iron transport system substrate-binding protein